MNTTQRIRRTYTILLTFVIKVILSIHSKFALLFLSFSLLNLLALNLPALSSLLRTYANKIIPVIGKWQIEPAKESIMTSAEAKDVLSLKS